MDADLTKLAEACERAAKDDDVTMNAALALHFATMSGNIYVDAAAGHISATLEAFARALRAGRVTVNEGGADD